MREVNPIVMLSDVMEKLAAAKARQNAGMAAEARAAPPSALFEPLVIAKRGRVGVQEVNICFVIAPLIEKLYEIEEQEAVDTKVEYHYPANYIPPDELHHCTKCDMSWSLDDCDEDLGHCSKCNSIQTVISSIVEKDLVAHCKQCGTKCELMIDVWRCHGCRDVVSEINLNPDKGPTSYCECCGDICEQKPRTLVENGVVHQRWYCEGCGKEPEQLIDPNEMAN